MDLPSGSIQPRCYLYWLLTHKSGWVRHAPRARASLAAPPASPTRYDGGREGVHLKDVSVHDFVVQYAQHRKKGKMEIPK